MKVFSFMLILAVCTSVIALDEPTHTNTYTCNGVYNISKPSLHADHPDDSDVERYKSHIKTTSLQRVNNTHMPA